MTDKERLEELKKIRETILEENNFLTRCILANVFVGLEYMDYLIKQTERVRELEEENKRYREALEFYADEETYETKFATHTDEIYDPFTLIDFFTLVQLDGGEKARKALGG